MEAILKVSDIHTYYGDSHVLQGISFDVPKGTIVAVLGRNGVGKTTLIRSIIGFTPIRHGQILFKDTDIAQMPSYKIARMRMGLVPQGRHVFSSLTVKETLQVADCNFKRCQRDLDRVFTFFPRLKERIRHKGNELSGGEQQMLAIARALISNPDFILMDEPTEGLAPLLVEEIGDIILKLEEEDLSILLVEQNFLFTLRVSKESHVMNKGRIIYSSTPKELWENQEVKAQYLGV
jgi:branched-chain amino acid transport system ATP-binding protein